MTQLRNRYERLGTREAEDFSDHFGAHMWMRYQIRHHVGPQSALLLDCVGSHVFRRLLVRLAARDGWVAPPA
jgi:hypothetical protein